MKDIDNAVTALSDDNFDSVLDELFSIDWGDNLGDIDSPFYAVPESTAKYGSPTRCGKIIRKYTWRAEPPEKYIRRIYQELSAECAKAQTSVRFLNGGKLVPTRDGRSVAYEFEVGTHDGCDFKQAFSLSVPVVRR